MAQWGDYDRYESLQEIGVGAYGTVYRARDRENDGQIVALKRLRVQSSEEGMPLATVREIALLKQLERFDHPNIVRLLDVCCGQRTPRETRLMLVFEHVDYDLEQYIRNNSPVNLPAAQDITKQLLCGLDFLHSQRVVHRDLKPQNVLISATNVVRIADFGLARLYTADSSLTQVVVTLWYRAPEVLHEGSYHSGIDLWSCGCILAEILRGPHSPDRPNSGALFTGETELRQLKAIYDIRGVPSETDWPQGSPISRQSFLPETSQPLSSLVPESTSEDCLHLLEGLLHLNLSERLNASDALNCQWFTRNSTIHRPLADGEPAARRARI